tara:strand:+ start:283 stop:3279 length:2997 start_codon:yes stop_codon:yes gene_type:complete
MRKNLLFLVIAIIGLLIIFLFYLSNFGIKTNNFNSFIKNKIKNYDNRISLELNDVFLKLNLKELTVKVNTKNSKVRIEENFIKLSNIDINLNLIKFIRNQNSVEKIQIITDQNKITNVSEFLNSYKFNKVRSLIYSQINKGNIKAIVKIYFDKENEDNFSYEIKGKVKNANINLSESDKLNKINFNFNIKDKVYNFDDIEFQYQNINYQSKKISINDSGKIFDVKGKINNKKGLINPNLLSKLFNFNLDFLDKKKILIASENKFAFKIKHNLSIKDFEFKSNLKFDEIFTNKKYQDLIYLKNGVIETKYLNRNLTVDVKSEFNFFDDKDIKKIKKTSNKNNLELKIVKKNKENFQINGNLKNDQIYINPNFLSELLKTRFDILSSDKVIIESNNNFNFEIDKNKKIIDLSINSILNFDRLNFNEKFQNLIYLKNGKIETFIKDKNFEVKIDSNYSFVNNKNNNKENDQKIKFAIKNNKNNSFDVETLFKTEKIRLNSKELIKYLKLNFKLIEDQDVTLDSDNRINFTVDKKQNISDLKIKSFLQFDKLAVDYKSNSLKKFIKDYNDQIYITGDNIEIDYSNDEIKINGSGKYSFNEKFENYKIKFINKKNKYEFDTFFGLKNILIKIDEINYLKEKSKSAHVNLVGSYNINNKNLYLKESNFIEGANKLSFTNLNLELENELKIKNIDNLEFNYLNYDNKLNNIKLIKYNDNFFELTGTNYDGRSLVNSIIKGNTNNKFLKIFKNLNSDIILNIEKFYLGDESYLEQIVGKLNIKKNKLQAGKIEAYLDKKNKFRYNLKTTDEREKITNLYIENPEPFIKNYKFIKGFKEGKLEFDSTEINNVSKSKLKIYDFKVKQVPLLAKILTLASLQGIADLLTGEGIRFDEFEMDYIKRGSNTSISEMYAIGPAMSILMEGYLVKDELTSLRGTLVPATTINNFIGKIKIIGDILVGSKKGEGVFGVSFKIKGPPDNLKTTVNPVKTIAPRFITRILEKFKEN